MVCQQTVAKTAHFNVFRSAGASKFHAIKENLRHSFDELDANGIKLLLQNETFGANRRITALQNALAKERDAGGSATRVQGVEPDLHDPSTATRLGLGGDARRAIEGIYGRSIVFVDIRTSRDSMRAEADSTAARADSVKQIGNKNPLLERVTGFSFETLRCAESAHWFAIRH